MASKRSERTKVDADWVLRTLVKIVERDPDGSKGVVPVQELLRALELIGKHVDVGAFRERVAVDAGDDLIQRLGRAPETASGDTAESEARERARLH